MPREGGYEDRGGYWAPVELWHRDAEHWSTLFQKGMRILVEGRTVKEDSEDNARVTFKVEARTLAASLPILRLAATDQVMSSRLVAWHVDSQGKQLFGPLREELHCQRAHHPGSARTAAARR